MTTKPDGAERRSLVLPVEHRADASGRMTVAGYAAVFGEVADIGGWFKEVVARGAFTNTLKTADVRAYFDHDTGRVLGRMSSGTLRCEEDDRGLRIEIDLPDTTDGRDVMALIERGDVSGMSFRFEAVRQEWDETVDPPKRTLLELRLGEVSVVSEPAYEGTSIALRSREEARKDARRQHNAAAFVRRKAAAEARFRNI